MPNAMHSCGTVEMTPIVRVLRKAFQKKWLVKRLR
jgi:hypothetical protein